MSLVWLVDAVFMYEELGSLYFAPAPRDTRNDLFLGLSMAVLALVIWAVSFLVSVPKVVVRTQLFKKR